MSQPTPAHRTASPERPTGKERPSEDLHELRKSGQPYRETPHERMSLPPLVTYAHCGGCTRRC